MNYYVPTDFKQSYLGLLLKDLISQDSVTPAQKRHFDLLQQHLTKLGFVVEPLPFGNDPVVHNIVATWGQGGQHIAFAGHMDVVPTGDVSQWSDSPFSCVIKNDTVFGRGIVDMKGAIACFIAAMKECLFDLNPQQHCVSLILTGDEEGPAKDGTIKILDYLQKNGRIPNACLVGEPTSENILGDMMKVGRRGSLNGYVQAHGVQGHVAYPYKALNPVQDLLVFLNELSVLEWDQGCEFFDASNLEITSLSTDTQTTNVIPGQATSIFNIRFNTQWERTDIIKRILALAEKYPTLKDGIRFEGEALPFINQHTAFADLVRASIYATCQKDVIASTTGGTSDARFIQAYCPVVEFGLKNKTAHKIDEHAPIQDLRQLQDIYAAIVRRFFCIVS